MTELAPLRVERRLDSRIWGGSTMAGWLGLDAAPAQLAESWQVYAQNRVVDGRFAGRTLADLANEQGAALLGSRSFARSGPQFPLLAKFLDAADNLSIQVHPDDAYAHQFEAASGFDGKTEAWYILEAAPGAALLHGLNGTYDRAALAEAVKGGRLLDLVRQVPVQAGDTIFVPAGTIHAITAGIMLFEIQQTSDLTYRVYDYDRRDASGKPRELHLERALDVINYGSQPAAHSQPQPLAPGRDLLMRCPYFAMERWVLDSAYVTATDPASFEILTLIDGAAGLAWPGGELAFARGESLVLPAALGPYALHPTPQASMLRCYVPADE